MLVSLLGKTLAAKITIGVAGLSMTGVAVAAETGSLPAPVQQAAYRVAGDLGVPAADETTDPAASPSGSASTSASASPEPSSDESGAADGKGPDATGPAAQGLCHAFRAGADTDNTAQRALASAAGGAEHVGEYCDKVLGTPSPDPSGSPSAKSTGHDPTAKPTTKPAGKPSTKPAAKPTKNVSTKGGGKPAHG